VDHDGALCCHFVVVGRLIMVPATPNSSARCRVIGLTHRNTVMLELWEGSSWCHQTRAFPLAVGIFFCVFHVIAKLSECQGLTWPSNVTGVDAQNLCCPTTSTSLYGSENHTPPEPIVGRVSHAAPSCRALHQSTFWPAWLATKHSASKVERDTLSWCRLFCSSGNSFLLDLHS